MILSIASIGAPGSSDDVKRRKGRDMNTDTKTGLGVVAAVALCCGGPLVFSALASGAAFGALGALWDGASRPLLLGTGALLLVAGVWLLARKIGSHARADAPSRVTTVPTPGVHHRLPNPAPTSARHDTFSRNSNREREGREQRWTRAK